MREATGHVQGGGKDSRGSAVDDQLFLGQGLKKDAGNEMTACITPLIEPIPM